jgi:hypothetical protein
MVNYNFQKAYLTVKNGVLIIKHSGKACDRVDNLTVHFDHSNVITCQYNYLHWRDNERYYGYEGHNLIENSIIDPATVLPEYTEEYKYYITKTNFWSKGKKIERTKLLTKVGEVRLNLPPLRKQSRTNINWYIETISEEINTNLNQKPIL